MRWREEGACISGALRIGAVVVGCALLANCASSDKLTSRVDPKYGVAQRPRGRAGPAGAQRGRGLSGRQALSGRRPHVCARREPPLPGRRLGVLVWPGFPRPPHCQWRDLRHGVDLGSPSDAPMPSYVRVTNLANRSVRSSCESTTAGRITPTARSTCRRGRHSSSTSTARASPGCGSSMSPRRRWKGPTIAS